jgi:hypothetical protein
VAFSGNSLFHNFFDSTLIIWMLAGFSIALCNVASLAGAATTDAKAPK